MIEKHGSMGVWVGFAMEKGSHPPPPPENQPWSTTLKFNDYIFYKFIIIKFSGDML